MVLGKKVSSNFTSEVDSYWIGKEKDSPFSCPNVSLFRLIGAALGNIENKIVLEVGFSYGADLMECKRRGANVFGLDLNPKYVENVKKDSQCDVRVFRAGADSIPFDLYFDLIYSRDMICYLTDDEIKHFFEQCTNKLQSDGVLIIQFIETDLRLTNIGKNDGQNFNINLLNRYSLHQIHANTNPIRFLDAEDVIKIAESLNLQLSGSSRMLQSYDLKEEEIRVDKYLVFKKL